MICYCGGLQGKVEAILYAPQGEEDERTYYDDDNIRMRFLGLFQRSNYMLVIGWEGTRFS